ncbi:Ig-like domain-containing protein [Achromobacter aegrifaciens]
MALSAFLLFQGSAAPLADELRKPLPSSERNAPPSTGRTGAPGEMPDQDAAQARAQAQAQARARAAGGLDPAPDLEGRPLPANPNQMASGDARSLAGGRATGEAKRAAESWLGQFGTARLDLLGSFHGGALDILFPVHDSGTGLIFSQFGARRTNLLQESYRTTVNLGVGYRHFADGFMVGGNAFLDQDVSRGHRRLGLGGEWWADYLKLSMNGYFRLSDWKRSPDMRDYQERPASGWDVRTEGYLPWYPQLGGKLMFEKYYGDEVGLFGASNRQKNPRAWTLGVSYTPAPAVTLGLDHRMGQGGKSDTSFKLGLKYALGVPLAKQMQPGEVVGSRKLAGMRMDLVERNNEIVLEYKKNAPLTIRLPSATRGYPQTVLSFPVTIVGAGEAPTVEWSGSAAAFTMPYGGGASGAMTLPAYNIGGVNTYRLTATAIDAHGRKISSNVMEVNVNPLSLSVARSKAVAMADGMDSVRFTAQVRGVQAEPMAGRAIAWTLRGPGAIKESSDRTDADGLAFVMVSSKVAAMIEVEATEAQGFKGRSEAEFLAAPSSANVAQLDAAPASILANGRDKTVLTATVKDGKGNAVGAGVAVNWTATGGQLSSDSSNTDASGVAVAELLSAIVPGTAVITAKAGAEDPGKSRSVDFLLDASDAKVVLLTSSKAAALANGLDTATLTATVADGRGNPVGAGIDVHWGASLGTLGAVSSSTDTNSQATVVLTAPTMIGQATVTAKCAPVRQGRSLGSDPGKTAAIAFTANASSAHVIELSPSKKVGVANGMDTVTFMALVTDAQGNPVGAGVTVNWSASLGTLDATSITNGKSETSIVLTAPTAAGVASILAKAASGDAGKIASVTFTADVSTARVVSLLPMRGTSTTFPAGVWVNLRATVQDAYGNPVGAGVTITWSSDAATFDQATSTTSQDGTATNTVTHFSAGAVSVKAQAVAGDPGKALVMNYVADPSRDYVITLNANQNTSVADGIGTTIFTAVVRNQFNDPVGAGITVHWTTTGGTLAASTSMTDAAGAARIVLTAPSVAGEVSVSAKAGAKDENNSFAVVTFKNSASSPRVGSASTSKTRIVANGRDSAIFTAMVLDGNGNSRGEGHVVNWSTDLGTLDGVTSKTNASGAATAVLTAGTVAGLASVTARVGAGDPGATVSVTLMADPLSPRVASLTASKTSGRANGTDTVTLTATVRDANGNLEDAGIIVNWTTNRGTLAAATSSTNARGMATVQLRAPTSVGTAVLTARTVAADLGKTARVKFASRAITPPQP